MSQTKKWDVTFTTPASKGKTLKETIEDTSWQYAKLKMESKYDKISIKNYTPSKK